MTKVMPSQVVAVIDELFPFAARFEQNASLTAGAAAKLKGLVTLIREIPAELIDVSVQDYAALTIIISEIETILATWISRGPAGGFSGNNIVTMRQVLARCPDEFPPPATNDLSFISDVDLRTSVRADAGAAGRAFANAEWKGATVLAGSVIEALLHWKLTDVSVTSRVPTAATAVAAAKRWKPIPTNLDDWALAQFIAVAEHLGILTAETATAAGLAKDFRNLIHPGRAARLGQVCDRGTAHTALGALDHVVRDLS